MSDVQFTEQGVFVEGCQVWHKDHGPMVQNDPNVPRRRVYRDQFALIAPNGDRIEAESIVDFDEAKASPNVKLFRAEAARKVLDAMGQQVLLRMPQPPAAPELADPVTIEVDVPLALPEGEVK